MRLTFTTLFLFVFVRSLSQELPLYNQYVFDPYLINPSYVAQNGFSQLNLLYKVQWTGVNDAPTTSAINFQYVASPKISLGISAFNQEVVLLSTTSAMATFGYRVPFNRNSVLSFGLSAGASMNRLKLEEIEDLNDPVLARSTNATRMDGQFGVNFTHKKLTIGFSLLRLLENNAFDGGEFSDIEFSRFKNKAATIGYRLSLGNGLDFIPYFMYRFNDNYSYFEATGMISYKNTITVGGFYRQDYGPGLLIRLRLSKKIDVGYSHEFASAQAENYLGGSHEVQFKMMFGEKANELLTKREASMDTTSGNEPTQELAVEEKAAEKPDRATETGVEPSVILENKAEMAVTRPVEEPVNNLDTTTQPEQITPEPTNLKYSLVIGTFRSASNAISLIRSARAKGVRAEMAFVDDTGFYYVYLPAYTTPEDVTVDYLLKIRDKIPYKDAWYRAGVEK